jgi:hydroxypyruvate isomerase
MKSKSPLGSSSSLLNRRQALGLAATAATTVAGLSTTPPARAVAAYPAVPKVRNGRIKQSVVPWCFRPMPEAELIGHAARLGLKSVELIAPKFWPLLKEHNLTCAIASSHGFSKGFAHTEEHAECLALLQTRIDECAAAGVPSVITFSGFRRKLTDEVALRNMVDGLKKIAGHAEKRKVTLCLEMLNSRVAAEMKGHPDYFCDDIDQSVEICRRINSERVKVLFDIYHVQIMHGDVITRIRQHKEWIGHYHTAGNPGRNEIDDSQEIHYPAIMKAILETGYQGYVGQEFIPVRDKVASLAQAIELCDV